MIDLMVVTDGRRACLEDTLEHADRHLAGIDGRRVIVNDSLDPVYWAFLDDRYGSTFDVLHPLDGKRGFAGAIQAGWEHLGAGPGHVFHLEDDFRLLVDVDAARLVDLLEARPELVQVALLRQPWNQREVDAGGLIAADRPDFTDEGELTTHARFFTTNPSVYRRSLLERGWPQEPQSEGLFWHRLKADRPDARSAFWGGPDDAPTVWHTGDDRLGHGY